jgi:HK97 family phage portal protein
MAWLADRISTKTGSTLDLFRLLHGGKTTSTGKAVNVGNAIEVATVFACCRVIGEGIAQVPLKLMQESADGTTRQPAKSHRLYNILAFRPNRWMTSFEYRELIAWHVVLTGNHYSFINRIGNQIVELYPFEPGQVRVTFESGTLEYEVTAPDGTKRKFPAESIWHIRGPSWSGWYGLEAVKLAREAIGLAMATEEAAGALHKNGVRPSGVYSFEGKLDDKGYESLSKWIETYAGGGENTGKPLILDREAKWQSTQMTGIDAQTLEMRRFQIEEICRFARVMPIMVGYSDKAATYASAEQMFLAHVVHTLAPWYQRLEQSIDANLLTERDRKNGVYSCFVEEGLLRGSLRDTKDTILGYVNGGILTPNEGRAKLDVNPDSDPDSDKLRIPSNVAGQTPPTDSSNEPPPAAPDPAAAKTLDELGTEVKRLQQMSQSPPVINVDARTTIEGSQPSPVTAHIHMPDQKSGDVHVDVQPTVVNVAPADVKVDVQPTVVNVAPADVKVDHVRC